VTTASFDTAAAFRARSVNTDWATSRAISGDSTCLNAAAYTRPACRATSSAKATSEPRSAYARSNCASVRCCIHTLDSRRQRNPTKFLKSECRVASGLIVGETWTHFTTSTEPGKAPTASTGYSPAVPGSATPTRWWSSRATVNSPATINPSSRACGLSKDTLAVIKRQKGRRRCVCNYRVLRFHDGTINVLLLSAGVGAKMKQQRSPYRWSGSKCRARSLVATV
jgi:hypothetical protein